MQLINSDWITKLSSYQQIFVGFSGGLDSTVLLHCLASDPHLLPRIRAVHVHHGLSLNADAWEAHCQAFCQTLQIPFIAYKIILHGKSNIEEQARIGRYQVFAGLLTESDCLLLGHHADDQAETLLLQLLRGAGIDGMAAMPLSKSFVQGELLRPLLSFSRENLRSYAHLHKLVWVEDESNLNSVFSRNYVRNNVIPGLREKWPNLTTNLSRSVLHCQDAKSNLDDLALIDYPGLDKKSHFLAIPLLQVLNCARIKNILRVWFRYNNVRSPSAAVLNLIVNEIIFSQVDSNPTIQWDGISIKRYRETLYLLVNTSDLKESNLEWKNFPYDLALQSGYLRATADETGIKIGKGCQIEVRFRQGGELFNWHGQTKELKKLFQQWNVPPWERNFVPLIFINEILAAVVGYAVSDKYYSNDPEIIRWKISKKI